MNGIDAMNGAEKLAEPVINQGLVRFLAPDGDHDTWTDTVIERIRAGGVAWFGGTNYQGNRVMQISLCNYRTTDNDVARTIAAVRNALT